VYRFPGGTRSGHEWRDAIGDPDKRPPSWISVERGKPNLQIEAVNHHLIVALLKKEACVLPRKMRSGLSDQE